MARSIASLGVLGAAAASVVLLWAIPAPSESVLDQIVGTWRGSSTCVNREAAPACNDEQVVYEISAASANANKVLVKAGKIENGKRVPMGIFAFAYNTGDGTWTTEFETPRLHALWMLTVREITMSGTMTLLPSKVVVRRMALKKDKKLV